MKLKINDKVKTVAVFELKLLVAVALLGLFVYFGTHALIVKSAEVVANAYTDQFFQ